MLICEELFLLLTKDSGKPESRMTYPVYGLTGALLTDLLLAGRISLTEERSPRIYIVSSEPTGHPVLDRALEILPAKDGKRFSSLVSWGRLNPTRHIAESLAAAGVVRIHTGGLFGSLNPSYPTLDPSPSGSCVHASTPPCAGCSRRPPPMSPCCRSCRRSGSHRPSCRSRRPVSAAESSSAGSRSSRGRAPWGVRCSGPWRP